MNNDRIRRYNLKSARSQAESGTDTDTQFSSLEEVSEDLKVKVYDRFAIILNIFKERAASGLSKAEIELAYIRYMKSRLTRGGSAKYGMILSKTGKNLDFESGVEVDIVSAKQKGHKGATGGAGETQLELERRNLKRREQKLTDLIKSEQKKKENTQNRRRESTFPVVALVGYTNAGKTCFLNKVAKTEEESENNLFQTLSTKVKKARMGKNEVLLLDTIGFISNLPHELVNSFRATIDEIVYADVILHLVDISNPNYDLQRKTVYSVLEDILPPNTDIPQKTVFP